MPLSLTLTKTTNVESNGLQQLLFKQIKAKLPAHLSIAEEVAELLGISNDSAYRRIRGEKPLSVDELQKLAVHFNIAVDQLLNVTDNSIVFSGNYPQSGPFDLGEYLDNMLAGINAVNAAKDKTIWYEAKDMPLFYYFLYDELAAFKFFFWMKTALPGNKYSNTFFEDNDLPTIISRKGKEILRQYVQVPGVEIWSLDSINATLRQIEYYNYTGVFRTKDTPAMLYTQLEQAVTHIKTQADQGHKYCDGCNGNEHNYQLYYNEMFLGHNSIFTETDGVQTVFINHGVLNYMTTRDEQFCRFTKTTLTNIMKRSVLISTSGEKERSRFFNKLLATITRSREDVLKS